MIAHSEIRKSAPPSTREVLSRTLNPLGGKQIRSEALQTRQQR